MKFRNFIGLDDEFCDIDQELIQISISNLERVHLLRTENDRALTPEALYHELLQSRFVLEFARQAEQMGRRCDAGRQILAITGYGRGFYNSCVRDKAAARDVGDDGA